MTFSGSGLSHTFLRLFLGKATGGKGRSICHVDAEKEQQRLASCVARRDAANTIMLFLIAEAALHGCRAQCADYTACGADIRILILWFGTFTHETGRYSVLCAVFTVLVVCIYLVGPYTSDINAGQFLMVFDAVL